MTCDFAYVGAETSEEEPAELALNKDDLTFLNPGEQYTLSVTGAPEGARIAWQSSDESIVTVSENGVLTAKGKGTTTVKATVDGSSDLTCIVRCNFEDSSDTEGTCTISNSDVTMGVKGETFQISCATQTAIRSPVFCGSRATFPSAQSMAPASSRLRARARPISPRPTTASPTSALCAAISNNYKKQRTQEPPASAVFMPPDGCASGTAL